MPDAVSLPPRSALPRDVEVPVLPGLGRTWYDRGGNYWARRAGLALIWAVALLFIVLIDVGIFTAIRHSSQAAFAILLTVDVVLAVAVLGYFAVRTVRRWNTPSLPGRARAARRAVLARGGASPEPPDGPRPGSSVTGPRPRGGAAGFLSGLAQLGYVLAVLAAAVVFLFCPALILALFLMSLLPETLPERQARLWMAGRLRDHSRGAPGPDSVTR